MEGLESSEESEGEWDEEAAAEEERQLEMDRQRLQKGASGPCPRFLLLLRVVVLCRCAVIFVGVLCVLCAYLRVQKPLRGRRRGGSDTANSCAVKRCALGTRFPYL